MVRGGGEREIIGGAAQTVAVEADLARLLPLIEPALPAPFFGGEVTTLAESMLYSLGAGGKRVRPVLCLLAAESLGKKAESAVGCAVALEYVHTYSLIHDDLPAMDDDDLRRGRPTNHRVYGEGQAILAGDGLLTEAFAVLAADGAMPVQQRLEAILVLARAAGWQGMVGGQSLDLEGEALVEAGKQYDHDHLRLIHRLKTGALISASLELGGIAAGAGAGHRNALRDAGAAMGLAFQIRDDVLDATSTTENMGKQVGKDEGKNKITYPKTLGLEGAEKALLQATANAVDLLGGLPNPGPLTAWARYMSTRAK